MNILEGLLTINDIDPYVEYGAFLAYREGEDPMANYSALLTPPELKEQRVVEFDELDGVKLPAKLIQRWKEREVPLTFCIIADSKKEFQEQYYSFLTFLKEGNDGWLELSIPELYRTWRMYLKRVTPYDQIIYSEEQAMAVFTIILEEPTPNFSNV